MGANCSDLKLTQNAICNIHQCTDNVSGRNANSASPTDIYFIDIDPNTTYGGEKIPQNLVLKIFIDPSLPGNPLYLPNIGTFEGSKEMLYESEIYEHVVGPMMEFNFNPHFVKYYGRARNCTGINIGNIWLNKPPYNMNNNDIINSMVRNTYYMGKGMSRRPAFNDTTIPFPGQQLAFDWLLNNINNNTIKYTMICTQRATGVSLNDWLANNHTNNGPLNINTWILLIQLVSGLVALEPFECSHNDLHFGNIMVVTKPNNITRHYLYNDVKQDRHYGIKTNLELQHYDWDRGYVKKLGPNPLLVGDLTNNLCLKGNNCNRYIPQSDLLKAVMQIYNIVDSATKTILLDMIAPTNRSKEFFINRLMNGPDWFFFQVIDNTHPNGRVMSNRELKMFNNPSVFLTKLLYHVMRSNIHNNMVFPVDSGVPIQPNVEQYDFRKQHILRTIAKGPSLGDCTTNNDCTEATNCIQNKCRHGYTSRSYKEFREDNSEMKDE